MYTSTELGWFWLIMQVGSHHLINFGTRYTQNVNVLAIPNSVIGIFYRTKNHSQQNGNLLQLTSCGFNFWAYTRPPPQTFPSPSPFL